MDRHELRVDKQIREAEERGEFANLPGAGKPIPNLGTTYDENWWVREYMRREKLSFVGPPALALRKEAEDILDTVAKEYSERAVRGIVADLNARILEVRRGAVEGPSIVVNTLDEDEVVARWKEHRAG
ncbi:DnaJ family domain-containing protein [Longispora urticae]